MNTRDPAMVGKLQSVGSTCPSYQILIVKYVRDIHMKYDHSLEISWQV
jgi:hypothetical protein